VTAEFREASASVVERVRLDRVGPDTFVGRPTPTLRGTMFGGQIVGQCLAAAHATVDRHPWPVSLQLYFIAAPDPDLGVEYRVDRRRDGGRYAWRHLVACQNETVVVEAMAAFGARPTEAPHPTPLGLPVPDQRDGPRWGNAPRLDRVDRYFDLLTMGMLDVRFADGSPARRLSHGDCDPRHEFWVRPHGVSSWTPREVGAALALLSDVAMLAMPLLAMGELGDRADRYAMSFDHNLRFYATQPEIGWLLVRQESVVAGSTLEARAAAYAPDGRLVFTANQQGVVLAFEGAAGPLEAPLRRSAG
jgi:acyl-CoA thioesterase-2